MLPVGALLVIGGGMEAYLALISGLVGALLGATASIATVVVQARLQARRERTRDAVSLAIEEWKTRTAILERTGSGSIMPLAVFVNYHVKLMEAAERGTLTLPTFQRLAKKNAELCAVVLAAQRQA